jgi:hypothetical protein
LPVRCWERRTIPAQPHQSLGLIAAVPGPAGKIAANLKRGFARSFIRGRESLGLGDVKLAGVAGAWLGWIAVSLAIDMAALTALAAVLVSGLGGRKFAGTTRFPFGLFFVGWSLYLSWRHLGHYLGSELINFSAVTIRSWFVFGRGSGSCAGICFGW